MKKTISSVGNSKYLSALVSAELTGEAVSFYERWMNEYKNSPECLARDKLEAELKRLTEDPVIAQSQTCVEVIEVFLHCVVYRWSVPDSAGVLQPIGDEFRRVRNKKAAAERVSKDPKQAAKAEVKGYWADWWRLPESQRKKRYKSKSAFAKDMLDKFPEQLESQRVIVDWCGIWEKEASAQGAQSTR